MVDREGISALMDGEVEQEALAGQLGHAGELEELRECWSTYHLIGDVIRGDGALGRGVSAKVALSLASEPTVLAPRRTKRGVPGGRPGIAWAAAATVAGVSVAGWLALGTTGPSLEPRTADLGPRTVAVASGTGASTAIDSDMNEYMMVHQEYSPTGAMHGVGSYVRTASAR